MHAGGVTGDITTLLSRAADAAIRTKTQRITPELLERFVGKLDITP